jgi:hypothetical protein
MSIFHAYPAPGGTVTLSPITGGISGTYQSTQGSTPSYTDTGSISYSPTTGLTVQFASYTNNVLDPTHSFSYTFPLHV